MALVTSDYDVTDSHDDDGDVTRQIQDESSQEFVVFYLLNCSNIILIVINCCLEKI